jgi:hypothetical protein
MVKSRTTTSNNTFRPGGPTLELLVAIVSSMDLTYFLTRLHAQYFMWGCLRYVLDINLSEEELAHPLIKRCEDIAGCKNPAYRLGLTLNIALQFTLHMSTI